MDPSTPATRSRRAHRGAGVGGCRNISIVTFNSRGALGVREAISPQNKTPAKQAGVMYSTDSTLSLVFRRLKNLATAIHA